MMNFPLFNHFGRQHCILQQLRFVLRVQGVMIANLKDLIALNYDFFFVIERLLHNLVTEILLTFGLKAVALHQILPNKCQSRGLLAIV